MTTAPLAKAGYLVAKTFGWTPQQLQELTMAQLAFYVEMIQNDTVEK